jgi:hypothetical protein
VDGLSKEGTKAGLLQRECLALLWEHEAAGAIPTSIRFLFYELYDRSVVPKAYRRPDGSADRRCSSLLLLLVEGVGLVAFCI